MFEWKVNQIRVDMMERVLNHMERQGYEVQVIVPLRYVPGDSGDSNDVKTEMMLAGKKEIKITTTELRRGMPAVTPENLDVVYGRNNVVTGV